MLIHAVRVSCLASDGGRAASPRTTSASAPSKRACTNEISLGIKTASSVKLVKLTEVDYVLDNARGLLDVSTMDFRFYFTPSTHSLRRNTRYSRDALISRDDRAVAPVLEIDAIVAENIAGCTLSFRSYTGEESIGTNTSIGVGFGHASLALPRASTREIYH